MPMAPATEQLFQAALALPEDERLELVEALLAEQPRPDGLPFDPSWLEEIARRSAEIKSGAVKTIPWSEVREQAWKRLRERQSG